MWRALVVFGLVCLAAWGAVWLAGHPETVAITWQGREYSTSLAVGVTFFLALVVVSALLLLLVRFVLAAPAIWGRNARRRRRSRGYAAVTRGIVAVGSGDVAAAKRFAGEAERLLGHEPLALLLKAQSAQAAGNREGAEAAFRQMTDTAETRVLGLRGLFLEARRRGDEGAARAYAEEASRVAPAVAWAGEAVLEGHSADGEWRKAVEMIERRTSLGLIDRATSRRQRAVLHAADALSREEQDPHGALDAAQQAVRLAPDLVPAAALAGRLLSRQGDLKRAAKVLETAWKALPHPDLAAAYLALRPGDSATDRLHRAETLARLSSWSPESRFAIARAAIEARELPRARETLRPLLEERPSVRVCLMMAELERRQGQAGAVREWLARAARAPRDKAWIADGVVSERWAPVSPVTGRIDAFQWETPPEVLGAPAVPDEMPGPDETQAKPALAWMERPEPARTEPARTEPPPADAPPAPDLAVPEAVPAAPAVPPVTPVPPPPASAAPAPAPSVSLAEAARPEPPRAVAEGARAAAKAVPLHRDPDPVVFPVAHAPDDPGPGAAGTRSGRFGARG